MKEKITAAAFDQLKNAVWSDFLTNASPAEIHQSVISSNWDDNEILRHWIKNNPRVDKATLLIAYWMSAPRWQKQYADREEVAQKAGWALSNFDYVAEIEQKYIAGFWTTSDIALDPASDQDGYDWTSDYKDIRTAHDIPEIMLQKLEGRPIARPENFDDGLPMSPVDYAQRLWDLYDRYDF